MRLLHIGRPGPHLHRTMRLFAKLRPELEQEWVYPGQEPVAQWDTATDHEMRGRISHAWLQIMVDQDVFKPDGPTLPKKRGVLVACGWDNPEILRPINQALGGMSATHCTGLATPDQQALLYRSHQAVLSLRPHLPPSYTVVEACLCGAIPIVYDCPELREHFEGGGARFASLEPDSILAAVAAVRALSAEQRQREVARNLEYFGEWTEAARGEAYVAEVVPCGC